MFWIDEICEDIIKKTEKDSYLITDSFTPSGHAHIGSLRGVIVHNLIKEGLENRDKKAVFQFGFDDYDPMDGLPKYVDASFLKHMGMPLSDISAPDGKSKSFASQYADEFKKIFNKLGIEPKIVYTSELYRSGFFDSAIKIVLDNASAIREIYKKISGSDKGGDWFPLQIVCPQCGKLGTTRVTSWDGKLVEFECVENLVEWAKGCGNKGKISPYKGNGKLPWKVEWPSKWFLYGSDIEGEGKDHAASSGSREVADAIFRQVFKKQPPYDIPYEHILIGGAKMSSSKGLGVTANQISELLPADILKFLFVRTRAKRAIEFNPEGDTIPLLYDEFDRIAKLYRESPKEDLAQAFYYTKTDLLVDFPEYLLRFSKIAFMLQMPRVNIFQYAQNEKGSVLTESEKEEIENRTKVAREWLENYAPENYKFNIQEEKPELAKNFNSEQKQFLGKLSQVVEFKPSWTGEDLHQAIHALRKEIEIDPRLAFSAIYLSFLGKDSGPQAGWLLASLDHQFVINRLKEVSND